MANRPLPLVLTMGEPAGIGAEIALKSWLCRNSGAPPFVMIADPGHLSAVAAQLGASIPIRIVSEPSEGMAVWAEALPLIANPLARPAHPGVIDPLNAPATIRSIERAVKLVQQGCASALVTNPIQKSALYEAGFRYPGHTEYLAALAGDSARPAMMIANNDLRVVPVTIHLSLKDAIASLTTEAIVEVARTAANALRSDFGIAQPRLAIAGLNPHAGENGALGEEDKLIIWPAIGILRSEGVTAIGPMAPDTMFHARARTCYDAAICMYHDQALIPAKTLDFDHGVNITLGLPFVRTSPDHGTALDIAGSGTALPDSLIAALVMARDMAETRRTRLT